MLESARESLAALEGSLTHLKDPTLFSSLMSFISYYLFMIEFYSKNFENIISVKDLLMFKYIDMVKGILTNFHEDSADENQKQELFTTLDTINRKLYLSIADIKKQEEMNLKVDLKTIQDLIRTDF